MGGMKESVWGGSLHTWEEYGVGRGGSWPLLVAVWFPAEDKLLPPDLK